MIENPRLRTVDTAFVCSVTLALYGSTDLCFMTLVYKQSFELNWTNARTYFYSTVSPTEKNTFSFLEQSHSFLRTTSSLPVPPLCRNQLFLLLSTLRWCCEHSYTPVSPRTETALRLSAAGQLAGGRPVILNGEASSTPGSHFACTRVEQTLIAAKVSASARKRFSRVASKLSQYYKT